jgi:hypothetical protein
MDQGDDAGNHRDSGAAGRHHLSRESLIAMVALKRVAAKVGDSNRSGVLSQSQSLLPMISTR